MTAPTSVFEWTKHLRYVRVGRTAKLVGLMLATFANPDGTEAYPGVARLAVSCGLDYKTIKRALADLAGADLIVKADQRSGKRGRHDVYYLTLPDWTSDTEVWKPDEFNNAVEKVRAANRRKSTGNESPRTKRGVQGTAVPVPVVDSVDTPTEVQGLSVPPNGQVRGTGVPQYGDSLSAVPIPTPEPLSTFPSSAADLFTASHGPYARVPDQDPDFAEEKKTHLRLVQPPQSGHGFCLACYAAGKVTLAVDIENGSACDYHQRQEAS